mmetsp:Transcript_156383/g.288404  ORF Transcript_156383/g.288404 Transcript_156383/m.288404 type:complete len:239 (+) Transcript_156383:460-1176(+)
MELILPDLAIAYSRSIRSLKIGYYVHCPISSCQIRYINITHEVEEGVSRGCNDRDPAATFCKATYRHAEKFNFHYINLLAFANKANDRRRDIYILSAMDPFGSAPVLARAEPFCFRRLDAKCVSSCLLALGGINVLPLARSRSHIIWQRPPIWHLRFTGNKHPLMAQQGGCMSIAESRRVLDAGASISRIFWVTTAVSMSTTDQSNYFSVGQAHAVECLPDVSSTFLPAFDAALLVHI